MKAQQASECYQEQLCRWVKSLATGDIGDLCDDLAQGEADDVQRFLDNSSGERHKLLRQELEFVALAFDDFEGLISDYMRAVRQTAYDVARSDREQFLYWLCETRFLTPRQHDFVACQQAEYDVAALARKRRTEHRCFQRLRGQLGLSLARLDTDAALLVHLNPIRVWTRLRLPGRDHGDVLFFAAGERAVCVGLEPAALDLIELLVTRPRTVTECTGRLRRVSRKELTALCRDLADKGLLALV